MSLVTKIKYETITGIYMGWEVTLELCVGNEWFWMVKLFNENRVIQEMKYGNESDCNSAGIAATTYIDEYVDIK